MPRPYKQEEIKSQINRVGARSNPRFKFISEMGRAKNGERLIKVINLKTKQTVVRQMNDLKLGKNPWNETQDRHEERVIHPMVKTILKKLNLSFEHETRISRRSRVDFVLTNRNNRKILLEIKSDKKSHSSKELTEQISKYKTDGKLKYGNAYAATILVSPNGRYGFPLKDLPAILKQKGLL